MLGLGMGLQNPRKVSSLVSKIINALKSRSTYFENEAETTLSLKRLRKAKILKEASILITPTAYSDGVIHASLPIPNLSLELIIDGNFENGNLNAWQVQNDASLSGNQLILNATSVNCYVDQNIIAEYKKYLVTIDVESISITDKMDIIDKSGVTQKVLSIGINKFYLTGDDKSTFRLRVFDNAVGVVNSISVKQYINADINSTRGSLATRTNDLGMVVSSQGNDITRLDYTGQGNQFVDINGVQVYKHSELIERQSTNFLWPSEGTVQISNPPFPTDGFFDLVAGDVNQGYATAGLNVSVSFIVKKTDGSIPTITSSDGTGDLVVRVAGSSGAGIAGNLTSLGNGFYLFKLDNYFAIGTNSDNRIKNRSGEATYISRVQYEIGDLTSYIKTETEAVTRLAAYNYSDPKGSWLFESIQKTNLWQSYLQTQDVTVTSIPYTASFYGLGTITFTGAHTGTLVGTGLNERVSVTFTPSAGTLTRTDNVTTILKEQLEVGFLTSYIPNIDTVNGVTRLAEEASKSGLGGLINRSEGTFYLKLNRLISDINFSGIGLNDHTNSNSLVLKYRNTLTKLSFQLKTNGSAYTTPAEDITPKSTEHVVVITWENLLFKFYFNNVLLGTTTVTENFIALNKISFSGNNSSNERFSGNLDTLGVWKRSLTLSEITSLND